MSARLEVHTLGPYRIVVDGQPLTSLSSRTAEALLIYLMRQTRPVARDVLADFFWDERDSARAAANLRTVLTMLRKPLGDFLHITRRTVAFNHDADYWLDLAELEAKMARLAPVLSSPEPPGVDAMRRLDATLALVQGDFLEGFYLNESRGFEEWVAQTQNRVRRLAERGLQRLVEACLVHGEYAAGVDHADRLLMLDPYNEAAHQSMMWLLARSGRRNAALAHFEAARRTLEEEIGVGPEEETLAVYRRLRSLTVPTPVRLPPEPTPFVGRDGEAEEIVSRLHARHCRLLTLLGPGGIGKTRLALRAAQLLAAQGPGAFLDGIYFVPLADAATPQAFAVALTDALGIPVDGLTPPAELARRHLQTREALLVLDSIEHLLAEEADEGNEDVPEGSTVAQILALLAQAPQVRLLVTSRVRLNLQEEWVYDVDGLDYPRPSEDDPQAATDPNALRAPDAPEPAHAPQDYAAGRLFVQQAARVQRLFQPHADDAVAIVRICRLLDGQPLGLELAGAWTRVHTCGEIAHRIAQDLDFLGTTLRNVPPRQRSLRAVFDYSWALLTPAERVVMQRLAVFVGPVGALTAHAVAQIAWEEMDALADKSLLRKLPDGDTFMMHDLVRQYAREKLAAAPDLDAETRRAYCRYFAAYVAQREPLLHAAEQLEAQTELHQARHNLRAAWYMAVERGWWDEIDAMLEGYYWYLWRRSEMQEAHALLRTAHKGMEQNRASHERPSPNEEATLRLARLQSRWADARLWVGEYEEARQLAEVAGATLRNLHARKDLAWVCDTVAQVAYVQGNYEAARGAFEEALDLFRQEEITEGVAHTLSALGNVLCDGPGDYDAARELYAQSLVEYQLCGDRYGQAKVTINMGALDHSLGQHAQAAPFYAEGIELCRALNHRQTLAIVLNNMGQVQKVLGNLDEAVTLLEESVELRRELGDRKGLALTLLSLANVAGELDDFAQAYRDCAEAVRTSLQLDAPALLADILVGVAGLLGDGGQIEQASQLVAAILDAPLMEGEELRQTAQEVRVQLIAQDRQAAEAGAAQAAAGALGHDLLAAAHHVLVWLNAPRQTASEASPQSAYDSSRMRTAIRSTRSS